MKSSRHKALEYLLLPVHGLFQGLPLSKSKAKARRLKVVGEAFAQQKIERLRQVQKEVADAIIINTMRVDMLKDKLKPKASKCTADEEETKNK